MFKWFHHFANLHNRTKSSKHSIHDSCWLVENILCSGSGCCTRVATVCCMGYLLAPPSLHPPQTYITKVQCNFLLNVGMLCVDCGMEAPSPILIVDNQLQIALFISCDFTQVCCDFVLVLRFLTLNWSHQSHWRCGSECVIVYQPWVYGWH